MPIAAGSLNKWILIEAPPAATDQGAFGEPKQSPWTTVASVWALVEDLGGGELVAAQQVKANVTVRLLVRWRADLNATMRATWRSRTFYFEALLTRGEEEWIEILCRENRA